MPALIKLDKFINYSVESLRKKKVSYTVKYTIKKEFMFVV